MTLSKTLFSALAAVALFTLAKPAAAQYGGGVTFGSGGVQGGTYGGGPTMPQGSSGGPSQPSSDFEIGVLYVAATSYGIGTGIWIDAEAKIDDPGLRFIAPGVLGVAAPIGVYFLDQPKLPRGVPAAISTGLFLGAGEGFGIWSYQYVTSSSDKEWGFTQMARATFIGSTVGGVAGAAAGFLQEPSPKLSVFLSSTAVLGGAIGTMFGYGATRVCDDCGYGDYNDGASLGGLIGYNAGIAAAAGLSAIWVPKYKNSAMMWIGGGIGFLATSPVYLFYAGSDKPAKRGLIVQGVGTSLGVIAGAAFSFYDRDEWVIGSEPGGKQKMAGITGISPMPVPGGMGAQVMGFLF